MVNEKKCPKCPQGYLAIETYEDDNGKVQTKWLCDECKHKEEVD